VSNESDYSVGYRKPPKETQFPKGRSGNPKGRPKASKSFMLLLAQALDERVWINEGGRRRSISKREALAKQFANKGAAGDIKAAKILLELIQLVDGERDVDEREGVHRAQVVARERVMKRLDALRENLIRQAAIQNDVGVNS
jgi:hypothetical protein